MVKNIILFVGSVFFLWGCHSHAQKEHTTPEQSFLVQKTEAEWKEALSSMQYHVLREGGTEPRHSSALIALTENGEMHCAACGNLLFYSENKYTTSSSWPSFDRAVDSAVVYTADYKLGYKRIEVRCAQCGSHLGHVFNDGPKETTGKRYCIDGAALNFRPDEKSKN